MRGTDNSQFKKEESLKKKNKIQEFILPSFKTYYETRGNKTVWYWDNDRHTDQ